MRFRDILGEREILLQNWVRDRLFSSFFSGRVRSGVFFSWGNWADFSADSSPAAVA